MSVTPELSWPSGTWFLIALEGILLMAGVKIKKIDSRDRSDDPVISDRKLAKDRTDEQRWNSRAAAGIRAELGKVLPSKLLRTPLYQGGLQWKTITRWNRTVRIASRRRKRSRRRALRTRIARSKASRDNGSKANRDSKANRARIGSRDSKGSPVSKASRDNKVSRAIASSRKKRR